MGTLAGREVFSGTHMSRQKTYFTLFRRCDGETLRGFLTLCKAPLDFERGFSILFQYWMVTVRVVPFQPTVPPKYSTTKRMGSMVRLLRMMGAESKA